MKTINSFRSKLLALTLALMASVSTFAYDYHGDLLCYNVLTDSTVAVTGQSEYKTMPRYEYLPENLVIPAEVTLQGKTYKVVSIDQWAFYACTMLKSVTIPSSVTFIGLSAFQYCENLVNVDIPTSVTTVEGSAFSYTKWYDNLPDGEVYINNTLYRYKGTAPENTQIVVKDGTTRIAGFTFWNQSNIVSIELPQSLTVIEQCAFEGCTQLSSILIPKNVTFIGCSAFAKCTGLMEVICLAPTPPIAGVSANPSPSDWMFAGVDVANVRLYVPVESIELYRNADQWKDFQIRIYYGSEECHEYMHVNLTALPLITGKLTYRLSTDDGSEIPYVDSVWILNTDKEPLRKFYAQSGDTIDLLFLERGGPYILNVYLNECRKSRTFVHRPKWKYTWCDTWNVMWFDGMRFDETASTSQYRLGKDTVIGDYRYSKFTSRTSVRFTDDKKVYVYYEGFDDNDPYTEDLPTGEYLAYDFSAQVGDTLEVFSGSHSYTTEQCVVYDVQTDPETNLRTIMLHPLRVVDGDGNVGVSDEEITWLEGVGSPNGFLISTPPTGGGLFALLCAYRGDELKYTGSLYDEYGCEYSAGVVSDDLFPTLSGLQRTICREYYEQADNKTRMEQFTNLTTRTETGAPYIYCSPFLLREKDNKILIYSRSLNKDLVLYDFNLQVGDSLPMLYIDFFAKDDWIADSDMEIWCIVDYHKDLEGNILPADTLIVTDVSAITLLDGKEYKKWTFNNGMEYVEGIGSFGNRQWSGDFFQLIANRDVPTSLQGEHLVCVSKNNKLLYQMDEAEMERLGAECLCEVETSYKSQWCDTWNVFVENGSVYPPHEETYRYQLAQDIVIGDYTYTAVVSKAINDALDAPHYVAAVRFTDDRKVYIYYDNAEYLLYDFNVQEGDELEVFAGINNYTSEIKTYKCTVTGVEQYACVGCPATITLEVHNHPDDFREFYRQTQWIEGVGDINGFLNGINGYINIPGNAVEYLLCAYQGDELKYTGDLYEEYGCGDNAEQNPEDLFPTLWGLQQTICSGYYGEEGDEWASGLTGPSQEITMMDGKPYLQWGSWYLREENDKILVYSEIQKKDLMLYDFTLELGDTLTTLNLVTPEFLEYEGIVGIVDYPLSDYDYTYPIDTLVVTELSKETLLDGKEYTRWKFSDGTVYVEGIGSMSETFFHHIADHLPVPVSYLGSYLVCVSKNNKLLYQMDPVKMDELGAECLCDYNRGPRKDNAKDGQIGGRPTPTQWNQLEVVLRQMDNNHTILQAETFSYTLEDISQQVNNKTYFQLARQSTKDTATTKSVVGALHFGKDEDNRVYFLRDGVEYVLYDFTAEIGDTVEIFAGINNYPQETTYTHVVVDKDTTEDGACRMFLEVVFPEETTTAENAEKVWLAGLGSVDGIVHNAAKRTSNAHAAPSRSASSSETESSVMLCAWREDSCLYTTNHPDYETFGCVYNQDPTSVEDISTSQSSYQKIIREGQFLILHNGKTYSVMGIEL